MSKGNTPLELNFDNYASNEAKKILFYKIGLIGPSRVGKTSIIAALLDEAQAALAGSRVSIKPFVDPDGNSPTKDRIRNTILDIKAGLDFSSFQPTGMGTADPFIFDLIMTIASGNEEKNPAQLRFTILDYPGGWLEKPPQGDIGQQTWEKCKAWIEDSSVIIVPIDANLIMEVNNQQTSKASRELLQVFEVEQLARDWAKGRIKKRESESGLLLFVPVKCETYFNDNGGNNDKSEELYKRIRNFYSDVIKAVEQEMSVKEEEPEEIPQSSRFIEKLKEDMSKALSSKPPSYSIEYHPVDTIGCIELANANWEENINGQLSLNCEYLVRNPGNYQPELKRFGNIGLLNSICKQIVENRQNSGIFRRLWDWLSDNDKLLADAINKISQQNSSPRFKQIAIGNIAKRG